MNAAYDRASAQVAAGGTLSLLQASESAKAAAKLFDERRRYASLLQTGTGWSPTSRMTEGAKKTWKAPAAVEAAPVEVKQVAKPVVKKSISSLEDMEAVLDQLNGMDNSMQDIATGTRKTIAKTESGITGKFVASPVHLLARKKA